MLEFKIFVEYHSQGVWEQYSIAWLLKTFIAITQMSIIIVIVVITTITTTITSIAITVVVVAATIFDAISPISVKQLANSNSVDFKRQVTNFIAAALAYLALTTFVIAKAAATDFAMMA